MDTFVFGGREVASASLAGTSAKRTAPLLFSPSVDSHAIFRLSFGGKSRATHENSKSCPNWFVRRIQREHAGSTASGTTESIQGIQLGIRDLSCHSSHTTGKETGTVTSARLSTQPAMAKVRDPFPGPARRFPRKPRDESDTHLAATGRPPRRADTQRETASPREGVARAAHVLIAPRCGRAGRTIAS